MRGRGVFLPNSLSICTDCGSRTFIASLAAVTRSALEESSKWTRLSSAATSTIAVVEHPMVAHGCSAWSMRRHCLNGSVLAVGFCDSEAHHSALQECGPHGLMASLPGALEAWSKVPDCEPFKTLRQSGRCPHPVESLWRVLRWPTNSGERRHHGNTFVGMVMAASMQAERAGCC